MATVLKLDETWFLCSECKYSAPSPHRPAGSLMMICTNHGSGYYAIGPKSLACNQFEQGGIGK